MKKNQEVILNKDILKYKEGEKFICTRKTDYKICFKPLKKNDFEENKEFVIGVDLEKYFTVFDRRIQENNWQKRSYIIDKQTGKLIPPQNNMKPWNDKELLEVWNTIDYDDVKIMEYDVFGETILKLALKFKRSWMSIRTYLLDKKTYLENGTLSKLYYMTKGVDPKTGKWFQDGPLNKFGEQLVRLLEENYKNEIKWK